MKSAWSLTVTYELLSYIVNVTIGAVATEASRAGGVVQGEEVQATEACLVSRLDTNSDAVVHLLIDNDVVASANGQRGIEVTGQVVFVAEEVDAVGAIQGQQLQGLSTKCSTARLQEANLGHIEDLHAVSNELTANNDVVLVGTNLGPPSTGGERRPLGPMKGSARRIK